MLSPRTPKGRIQYLRFLLILGASMLSLVHLFTRINYADSTDPYALRLIIAGLCLSLAVLSFYSAWVRDYITQLLYLLVGLGAIWVLYMLYINGLSPPYVVISILTYLACSLVMGKKQHLLIFSILFLLAAGATVYNIAQPLYNPTNYLIHISIAMVLLYIVVGNYIEANREAASMISNFQSLIDNTDTSYCLLDRDCRLLMINKTARSGILETQGKEALLGDSFTKFVFPNELEKFKSKFAKAVDGETITLEREISVAPERTVWLDIKFIPIVNKQSQIVNILLSARDITGKVTALEKIKGKNEELEKINGELDRFVYRAAHDLRAPLSSVLGLINVASMEKTSEGIKKYLGLMTRSVEKLTRYINDVIQHSYNSRSVVNATAVNLEDLVEKVFESHTFMDGAKEIDKQVISTNGKTEFYTDPGRLEIIMNNLISNAIKYQDPEKLTKEVKVQISVNEQAANIEIVDNGIGISDTQLDKIFDFFYRGNELATGSGIGLYIAKEAVDKIKGELEVSSTYGEGTKFRLMIPNAANGSH